MATGPLADLKAGEKAQIAISELDRLRVGVAYEARRRAEEALARAQAELNLARLQESQTLETLTRAFGVEGPGYSSVIDPTKGTMTVTRLGVPGAPAGAPETPPSAPSGSAPS